MRLPTLALHKNLRIKKELAKQINKITYQQHIFQIIWEIFQSDKHRWHYYWNRSVLENLIYPGIQLIQNFVALKTLIFYYVGIQLLKFLMIKNL